MIAARVAEGRATLVRFGVETDAPVEVLAMGGIAAAVSPDGRWVAYDADTTGRSEIWVRPLTAAGVAARISPNGGRESVWSRDGRELFYLEGSNLMAVAVTGGAELDFKPPVKLFDAGTFVADKQPPSFDVTADGRFVALATEDAPDIPLSVIVNWSAPSGDAPATH